MDQWIGRLFKRLLQHQNHITSNEMGKSGMVNI